MDPQTNETPAYLDVNQFVLSLMEDLGTADMEEPQKSNFYNELVEQASKKIIEAVIAHADDESLDETLEIDGGTSDIGSFLEKWIERSPEAQMAILEALESFRNELMEFFTN